MTNYENHQRALTKAAELTATTETLGENLKSAMHADEVADAVGMGVAL